MEKKEFEKERKSWNRIEKEKKMKKFERKSGIQLVPTNEFNGVSFKQREMINEVVTD